MKNGTIILIAVAFFALILLLPNWAPTPGTNVHLKTDAIGCQFFADYAQEWRDCATVPANTQGMVSNHPKLGSELGGRVRVVLNGWGPYWFYPSDLIEEK